MPKQQWKVTNNQLIINDHSLSQTYDKTVSFVLKYKEIEEENVTLSLNNLRG